jgi:hypothetical protein
VSAQLLRWQHDFLSPGQSQVMAASPSFSLVVGSRMKMGNAQQRPPVPLHTHAGQQPPQHVSGRSRYTARVSSGVIRGNQK